MKIRKNLFVISLLGLATLSWYVLDRLTGTTPLESVSGAVGPSTEQSLRTEVSPRAPVDSVRVLSANVEEPNRLHDSESGVGNGAEAVRSTKKFERWWIPMSPQEFMESFAKQESAEIAYLNKFDTDGDGFISKTEGASIVAEKMSISDADMIRYFDSDGDGNLSEIERAEGDAVMAAKSSETASWIQGFGERRARRIERFDADGDGRLNLDESYAAYLNDVDVKAAERFRSRYDTNGDRTIDVSDMAAFMALYADEDQQADANDDGVINERDIEAFEFMMSIELVP